MKQEQHAVPRGTRIIATIGPTCRERATLKAAVQAGADAFRINCSHSTPDSLGADVASIRSVARELDRPLGILLDLQGPKIRTGLLPAPLALGQGDELVLVMDPKATAVSNRVGCTYPGLAADLEPGALLLLDDGAMAGHVRELHLGREPAEIVLVMENGGVLRSRKGINVPGLPLSAPSLAPSDLAHLRAGLEAGIDVVALSFVRRARDILELRSQMEALGHRFTPICAKIEKPQALSDIDAILGASDMIMVARGDLGVEMDLARVPVIQKQLIHAANRAGVLVITATQMLDSMRRQPRPTRAEVTDVSNSILDGTDALLLTGETAAGEYPIQAIGMMDRVANKTEQSRFFQRPSLSDLPHFSSVEGTVTMAACYTARDRRIPLVVYTWSGTTAQLASKSRPPAGLFALSPNPDVPNRLALAWGVTTLPVPRVESSEEMIVAAERVLLQRGLVEPGQQVVILTGRAPTRGATNTMTVEVVGEGTGPGRGR